MKTLICSDFHLDIYNRLDDFESAMHQIADYAINNKINRVRFLGDAFQRRRPYPIEKRIFNRWIMKLVLNDIKVDLILGNHDEDKNVTTIEYFNTLNVKNVRVLKPPIIENGIYYNHILLKESKMGPLGYHKSINVLSYKDLINKYPKVKLFLLGHIHKPQVLNKEPLILHVGSVDRTDFGERGEKKYFWILSKSKIKPIELDIRPMLQYKIDVNNYKSFLKKQFKTNPIVKVVICGDKQEVKAIASDSKYWDRIKQNCYDLVIREEVTKKNIITNKISEENSTETNFLEYCKLNKLDEATIKLGLDIIKEVTTK